MGAEFYINKLARRNVAALGPTTDNYDYIQAAILETESEGGGTVTLGPGYHYLNRGSAGALKLTRDNARTRGKVCIKGDGAIVKLTSNVPRFLDFTKVADHDLFHDIEVSDLIIDANNIAGQHHVIMGTYVGGVALGRMNFDGITVGNVKTMNVFWDGATAPNHRLNIWFIVARTAAGTATDGAENYMKNFLFDDLHLEGGNGGIGVTGTGPAVLDLRVFMDEIALRRCWHSTMNAPTAFFGSTNFHIGSRGYGNRATIENCYGYGSGDTGIETNALQSMDIKKTTIEDCWNIAFYHTNYANPPDPQTQRVDYENCETRVVSDNSLVGLGYRGAQNLSVPLGTMNIRDCAYHREAASIDATKSYAGFLIQANCQIQRINIDGFTYNIEGFTHSSGSFTLKPIDINPTTAECEISMRKINLRVNGTNSATILTDLINITGLARLDIDGVDFDVAITGATVNSVRLIELGNAVATTLRQSRLAGLKVRAAGADTDPRAVVVRGTGTLTILDTLLIENSDFSSHPGQEVLIVTGVENKNKVVVRNCVPGTSAGTANRLVGTVASTANLPLPLMAEVIHVSGTNTITSLDVVRPASSVITLIFDGILTFTDGNNLKLNGNFVTTADDTITLASDGTNWYEVCRSVN